RGLPRIVRRVLRAQEDRVAVPVVALTGEEIASLEEQDAQAGRRKLPCERAAAGAAPDDDDVVVVTRHGQAFSFTRVSSGDGCDSDRCDADTMNPRCENACGKLPMLRFAFVSYSSEKIPTSFCKLCNRSNSSRASFSRPMSARLSTSQNVVSRNAPSPAGSPSTESLSEVG